MMLIPTSCPGCGSEVEKYMTPDLKHFRGAGYACGTAITDSGSEKSITGPCVAKLVTVGLAVQAIKTLIKQAESISGKIPTMEDEP